MFSRPLRKNIHISIVDVGTLNRRSPNGTSGGVGGIRLRKNTFSLITYPIQNPPHAKFEKVELLLNSAIHLTKSLKYRELYLRKDE